MYRHGIIFENTFCLFMCEDRRAGSRTTAVCRKEIHTTMSGWCLPLPMKQLGGNVQIGVQCPVS